MGTMRGVYLNNILTFKDTNMSPPAGTSPWEAFPMQAIEDPGTAVWLYDDFLEVRTAANLLWQVVKGTGGSVTLSSSLAGGWVSIPTAASQNDYQCFFSQAASFTVQSNLLLAFEAMVQVTEANTNNSSWFVGFTSTTTTGFLQNTGAPASSYSGAVIWKAKGAMAVKAQTSNGSTQNASSTLATAVSGTTLIVGGVINPNDNTTALFTPYVSTVASNLRSNVIVGSTINLTIASLANMYFGFGVRAGSASAETILVDYAQVAAGRYYQ